MKTRIPRIPLCIGLSAALVAPAVLASVTAQPSVVVTAAQTAPAAPAVAAPAPVATATATAQAPPGAEEVLKLSRAQLSEDVILSYVRNSRVPYHLSAKDILYLHNEGVSDKVISAMLEQQPKVVVPTAPTGPAPFPAPAVAPPPAHAPSAPAAVQPAPSTVYVTQPAPTTTYYYYDPYYYPAYYPGLWWPPVSFRFGFGFGHGWRR